MKNLSQASTIFIALFVGLLIGGLSVGYFQQHRLSQLQSWNEVSMDELFDDEFFHHHTSPFAMMEKLREDILPTRNFDTWFSNRFGGSIGDIKSDDTGKEVIYRVSLHGLDRKSVKATVNGSQVIISGEKSDVQAQEEKGKESRREFFESFTRSFPVPPGTEASKVQIQTNDHEIVLSFPKR